MKSLIIVESPTKVKTLSKFLGKDFIIKASVGHVKDLPRKEIGVDVDNGFKPVYVVINGKEKILKDLKKTAKGVERIFLAPDPDREGEAIAWHIAEELDGDSDKVMRVEFNEITERAVKEALKRPRRLDINLFNAQQARRVLDRLVGYKLSPLLWRKVRRGLSAGRVQSVALRLVVDREREIEAFKPEEYWGIEGVFRDIEDRASLIAKLYRYKDRLIIERNKDGSQNFLLRDKGIVDEIVNELRTKRYLISAEEKKKRRRNPPPPFITSTLQQESAKRFGFTAKKTMLLAQQLYEGIEIPEEGSVSLITYMRTDSVRVSSEAQQWAREYIRERYGNDYLPHQPPQYKSKKTAQEAHEAIRPTYPEWSPERVKGHLNKNHFQLYKLIWDRFIASQMESALLETKTYIIKDDDGLSEFRASGTVVRFPGFMVVYIEEQENGGEDAMELPDIPKGTMLNMDDIRASQHFTQPPPRYSEATLVKELEARGIGRPSTYATIISTIQERRYVEKVDNRFKPTELGILVNDLLVERFSDIMDYNFTARMEDNLDKVESGKFKWVDVVMDFYKPFSADLSKAMEITGKIKPADIPTDEVCEKCGKPMVIKWGRHGRFIACSGFPECKNRRSLKDEITQSSEIGQTDEVCDKCGSQMVLKTGRFGKFLSCSRYPECKNTRPYGIGIKCPEDHGEIVERKTKRGKIFYSCSNYPKCKFATWYKPIPRNCPKCIDGVLAERITRQGSSLICLKKGCGYKERIEASHVTE
ncbi:MAG: type I DNA topoisomerase [Thermodesulfovibrionia bacterium]